MSTAASITLCALRSGSSGNAVYVGNERTRLLIDAGVCARTLEQALGEIDVRADQLNAMLVTHEHSDHVAGVGVMMRRYHLPLYLTRATWQAMQPTIGRHDSSLVHVMDAGQHWQIGDLEIHSFPTPHDAADSVGYRIGGDSGSVSVLTDLGHVDESLLSAVYGSRAVLIEANYDPSMLMAGRYPYALKKRISGDHGHLSNEDCAGAIHQLVEHGTEHFQLGHLSRDNNYPELAMLTVQQILSASGIKADQDMTLQVARRFAVSQPLHVPVAGR